MIDMQSGRISYAVLSFGGFLGMGDRLFAVPWQALKLDTENKRFTLNVSKEQLKNAPGFDKDHWPTMADRAGPPACIRSTVSRGLSIRQARAVRCEDC